MAKKYLHREDGILFYEDLGDLPKWEPDDHELREDAIRMLAGADTYLYKQQQALQDQADEIMRLTEEIHESGFFKLYRGLRDRWHRR